MYGEAYGRPDPVSVRRPRPASSGGSPPAGSPGSGRRPGARAGASSAAARRSRQMSCAFQQRVWKRQAGGGLIGLGTSPGSRIRSRWPGAATGPAPGPPTAARRCTGASASGRRVLRSASSTILPRYITATRSRDVPDHRQVVRDEHVGQAELVLQVLQQVDDLGLDRHVQRGDRLVGDDQLGPQGERAGDADALALAAGELVRVAVVVLRVQPDQLEQVLHGPLDAVLGLHASGSGTARRRSCRPCAAGSATSTGPGRSSGCRAAAAASARRTGAVMSRPSKTIVPAGRLQQPGEQPAGGGLAAAGLADQAERLAPLDVEVEAVDGLHRADLAAEEQPARIGKCFCRPVTASRASGRAPARSAATGCRSRPGSRMPARSPRRCSRGIRPAAGQ